MSTTEAPEVSRPVATNGAPAADPTPASPARAPERTGTPTAPPRKNHLPLIIAGIVVLAALGFGVRQWAFGRTHVSTDNAQVEGHVIPLLPKVGGFVAEVRVRENQPVQVGDTLVVLDDRDLVARLQKAEADLAVALTSVGTSSRAGQADAQVAAARARVTQAEEAAWKAHADFDRYSALAARHIVGSQQLDAAKSAAATADAQLAAARQDVAAASAALVAASAHVASARATRDEAALQLSYSRVIAPETGVVSQKNVEVGELVQTGQPLMSVVPLDDVWVVANLKETEVRDVTPGDTAEFKVDAYPGRHFSGHVESISPASGARFSLLPPDNATGNFTKVVQRIPVRIALDTPQDSLHVLRPGMSVDVTITTR
jgi:membrane fusion protein, multidrug efflux system